MAMRATTSSSGLSTTAICNGEGDVKGHIQWSIPRFLIAGNGRTLTTGQEWNSPEVGIGKGKTATKWFLHCCKGDKPGILNPENFVAVQLCCKSFEDHTQVEKVYPSVLQPVNGVPVAIEDLEIWAKFRISLINKNGNECYTRSSRAHVPFSVMVPRMGFNNFISVLALNIHVSDLLPSGAITLFCEVEVNPELVYTVQTQRKVITNSQSASIGVLERMLDDNLFSDLKLVSTVDNKEHNCHKAVLAACSPVFKAMFENETQERKLNKVVIDDLEGSTIKSMLEYVYKGTVSDIAEVALELFQAAEKYQMLGLSKFCQAALTSSLSASNVGQVLSISHMYLAAELKAECFDFISRNAKHVIATEGWVQLEQAQPQLAIEFFRKNISERKRKRSNAESAPAESDSD